VFSWHLCARALLTHFPQISPAILTRPTQIRQHPFFVDIDWTALANGELSPPWEPTVTGSLDTSQFDHEFTSMPIHSPAAAPNGFLSDAGTFAGFSYSEKSGLAGMGSL